MLCDPLPDPENERDLTTFITLWRQSKDKTIKECADQCQISENVIRAMQNILGEAMANYNHEKVAWCKGYMSEMREIVLKKFDSISAYTLEYIENYTKIPPEEMEKMKNTIGGRKNESNIRQEFFLVQTEPDLRLGIYGNVAGKAQLHKYVEFGGVACKTPRQYGSQQLIIRALWTSYDDVTPRIGTYYPDIVVGGVVDFRLF